MYMIIGKNASGVVSLRRDTAVAAIKKAVELMDSGHIEVHVTAPDGVVYDHTKFDELRSTHEGERPD
jgi:hypothetical protein